MPSRRPLRPLLILLAVAVLLGAAAWFAFLRPGDGEKDKIPLWTVRRGPLRVTVLEGGSLEALESHTVVSRVEGQAAILAIIEEGAVITPEDVEAGRVLVRLDSATIEERLERQAIELAAARAAHENAVSNLEIQQQQNASDIRKAQLTVRFALLDLARYVGRGLVEGLVDAHRAACTSPTTASDDDRQEDPGHVTSVGLHRLILTLRDNEALEGEALQRTRQLHTDINLAKEEYKRAQVEYDWSERLGKKGYVSREEAEADRIALERRKIELERAETAQVQFAQYDFPKEVESLLSDFVEAEDQLSRTIKRARSAEAKNVAEVASRREQKALQEARNKKLRDQLEACVIRAERPGLVVYASSTRRRRWDSGVRIQEGTMVRERQPIIEIPDLSQLGVTSDIHESAVERVDKGQSVTVVIDALPNQPIDGVVANVAPLPNAPDWRNPDRKVYATTIRLNDVLPTLRPGMSAQVEILMADLPDVVLVPVQTVAGTADRPVVWVVGTEGPHERSVTLGLSNDLFVEVREGLAVGEQVLLAPPHIDHLLEQPQPRGK